MQQRSLYDLPGLYDRLVPPGPCEAFYGQLAVEAGGPVVELACGTGRLTLPLARRLAGLGQTMTGLDNSPAMLARARAKAAGIAVTLVEGDMRSFELGRRVPLVIISCNSLAHLTEPEDLRACLTRVARQLTPDGLLAFDVVNPVAGPPGPAIVRHSTRIRSDVRVEAVERGDATGPFRLLEWRVLGRREECCGARDRGIRDPLRADASSGAGAATGDACGLASSTPLAPLVLRRFPPRELPDLLAAASLDLVARHGDFAGSPLTDESANQVCIARVRRDR